MKRFLMCCMCLVLVVGLMPVPALGAETAKEAASTRNAANAIALTPMKKAGSSAVKIYVGSATKASAKLKAKGLVASKARWKSSKPSIAAVNRAGKVSARKAGNVTVTATQGKATYKFSVAVKNVTINKPKATVEVGKTVALKLTGDAVKSAKSSAKQVATVTKAGLVKGVADGKATITLTSKKGKKFTCKLTVTAPASAAVPETADYSALDKVKSKAAALLETAQKGQDYSQAAVDALQASIDAVRTGLPKEDQAVVDDWTAALESALATLKAQDDVREAAFSYIERVNAEARSGSTYPANGAVETSALPGASDGPQPQRGWMSFENGAVQEFELFYDGLYVLKTKNRHIVKEYDPAKLVNVKDHGAVGDGTADDDAAVKAAMQVVNENGGILYFPVGTYRVAISTGNGDGAITARSEKPIEVDFGKSTLELQANAYQAYSMVRAVNCADVEVRNGTFIGDRLAHDYESLYQSSHEWGKGVQATNNAACRIVNMDISQTTGDAIYCSNSGTGTTDIADCTLHHCRRQGISVVSADVLTVRDTDISFIGCPDETDTPEKVRGTAPMAGIDLEPNNLADLIKHARFENVSSHDNATFGLVEANTKTSAAVLNVEVVGCRFENVSTRNSITFDGCELTYPPADKDDELDEIKDCTIKNSRIHGEGGGILRLRGTTVDNCTFEGRVVGESGGIEFRLIPMNATITNSTFKNIQGKGKAKWGTGAVVDVGIPLADYPNRDPYCMAEGSGNNTYVGCGILIDNLTETGSTFKDCHVMKRGREYRADLTITKNRFESCTLKIGPDSARFEDCTLLDCAFTGTAGNATVYLSGSSLTCGSIAAKDYFPKSVTCDASTVEVVGDVVDSAFANVQFLNGSKIVLDSYASAELDIPTSVVGTDYTVECRGSVGVTAQATSEPPLEAGHPASSPSLT